MKPTVLATSWHPGGINSIIPVIKSLRASDNVNVIAVGYEYSNAILDAHNVEHATLESYSIFDIGVKSLESLIDKIKPDFVLTGTGAQNKDNSETIEQNMHLATKNKKISSLAVLDFWGYYAERFSDFNDSNNELRYLPDQIAVLDSISKNAMLDLGFDESILKITGNPYFDDLNTLAQSYVEKLDQLKQEEGLPLDRKLVLFAGSIDYEMRDYGWGFRNADCIDILCEGIKQTSDSSQYEIILKKHPRERDTDFNKLGDLVSSHGLRYSFNTGNTRKVGLASDLTTASLSTVLTEVSLMDKDAVNIAPGVTPGIEYLPGQLGILPSASDFETGIRYVRDSLESSDAFLEPYRSKRKDSAVDGKATERVCDLIYDKLNL